MITSICHDDALNVPDNIFSFLFNLISDTLQCSERLMHGAMCLGISRLVAAILCSFSVMLTQPQFFFCSKKLSYYVRPAIHRPVLVPKQNFSAVRLTQGLSKDVPMSVGPVA